MTKNALGSPFIWNRMQGIRPRVRRDPLYSGRIEEPLPDRRRPFITRKSERRDDQRGGAGMTVLLAATKAASAAVYGRFPSD
jgi:hypothetical protein